MHPACDDTQSVNRSLSGIYAMAVVEGELACAVGRAARYRRRHASHAVMLCQDVGVAAAQSAHAAEALYAQLIEPVGKLTPYKGLHAEALYGFFKFFYGESYQGVHGRSGLCIWG